MQIWLKPNPHGKRFLIAVAVCAALVYLALAFGSSLTKDPWHDEAQFANPALNLATSGVM